METAAKIMETSADGEQTVAGTDAFEPNVGDLPHTEENVAGMLLHCANFLTLVYLEAPVSEGMETDAAIDMPADTTATVSDDKVDITTAETVAAFPEVSNEETAQEAIITTEQINVQSGLTQRKFKLAKQQLEILREELLQWYICGFGDLDKYYI